MTNMIKTEETVWNLRHYQKVEEFNANNTKGTGAYVVTTFVANRSGFDRSGNPDNECGNGWGYYDLGLHNENFILKAKELGLGTLVMGIRDGEKIKEMLEILLVCNI